MAVAMELRRIVLLTVALLGLLSATARADVLVNVTLDNGVLVGKMCDFGFDASEFLGVPFALPPVGELRFRPPVYYDLPYPEGGFNATVFPPGCGTPCDATGSMSERKTIGEDCLFLNIYVPSNNSAGNLPVRVFIHGGANRCCRGSDGLLTGCSAASYSDSIVVVMQFRLGAFGFLAHPATLVESNTTGNWGILDQQMALNWVQRNIAGFGGDPNQVTLHGGSSGASAVALHNVIPGSEGLFRAAVTQSATCYSPLPLENSYVVRAELSANLGCENSDSDAEMECLRAADVASITNATADYTLDSNCYDQSHFMFSPTIDGTTVPMDIIDSISSGSFNHVPLLVGINSNEGAFFIDIFFEDEANVQIPELYSFLSVVYPGVDPEEVLAVYPEENYADTDSPMYRRVVDLLGDIFVKCPGYELLVAHSDQQVPTWSYYFSHAPSCPASDVYRGAAHGTEVAFVFRNVVDVYPPGGTCNLTDAEVNLSDVFLVAISSLASLGYPTFANGTVWPEWTKNSSISTELDTTQNLIDVGFGDRCGPLGIIAQKSQASLNALEKKPMGLNEYLSLKKKGKLARRFMV